MDDAGAVRLVERVAHLDGNLQRLILIERSPVAALGQAFGQGLAFEILQHEKVDALVMADVEQRADVRMVQRRDRAGLAVEAFAQPGVGRKRRGKHLDGHGAIEPRIARAVDLAHASCADERDDFIGAEAYAGGEAHERSLLLRTRNVRCRGDAESRRALWKSISKFVSLYPFLRVYLSFLSFLCVSVFCRLVF